MTGGLVKLEVTSKSRSCGFTCGILNTAGLDTVVSSRNGNGNILGLKQCLQSHQNLLGETFLNLWSAGKDLHDAINLGPADNLS